MNLWMQMEIEIFGKFSHPDIVKLLGYYYGEDREFLLVYEYMQNGSLDRHLYGTEESPDIKSKLSTRKQYLQNYGNV